MHFSDYSQIESRYLLAFLKLNPQLKSLRFGFNQSLRSMQSAFQNMQSLERIEMDLHWARFEDDPIHFENVKRAHIKLPWTFHPDPMPIIPLSFGKLTDFTIVFFNKRLGRNFFNFINAHPSISKLTCDNRNLFLTEEDIMELAEALPQLTDVKLESCAVTVAEVIFFTQNFKWLRKFCFNLANMKRYDELERQLKPGEWRGSIKRYRYVELERVKMPKIMAANNKARLS